MTKLKQWSIWLSLDFFQPHLLLSKILAVNHQSGSLFAAIVVLVMCDSLFPAATTTTMLYLYYHPLFDQIL